MDHVTPVQRICPTSIRHHERDTHVASLGVLLQKLTTAVMQSRAQLVNHAVI